MVNNLWLFIFSSILWFATTAYGLVLPQQMTRDDLSVITNVLGYGTSTKFLSNPFPMGGYSGFEFGFSTEFIDITDLGNLGAGVDQKSTFQYNRLSLGKGLYNDIDLYLHFVPFSNSNEITEYGGQLKWNFYQATYFPFTMSFLGQVNQINIQDLFLNQLIGWDLLGGIHLEHFSVYVGAGHHNAKTTFNKSILDATLNSQLNSSGTFTTRGSQAHSLIGMYINWESLFLAAQIDRYEQPIYSLKLGLRL